MNRLDKIRKHIKKDGLGLEIGPSFRPAVPKSEGYNVEIVDHCDAEQLKKIYKDKKVANIEEVDYIWNGEPLDQLIGKTGRYDYIVASHLLEHTPDLLSFLQQCQRLLKADGVLSLALPDKRFCFDYFRFPSSTGSVLQAWVERRTRHTFGDIYDHFSLISKLGEKRSWDKDTTGEMDFIHSPEKAMHNAQRSIDDPKAYIDIHNWKFIPASFKLIIADLNYLKLLNLNILESFPTEGCEFFLTLSNKKSDAGVSRIELCNQMLEEMSEMYRAQEGR